MKWNKKFEYPETYREMIKGQRHYAINDEKLPSVTTILSKTQTAEKAEGLANWRARVGEDEATRIMDQAAARGSAMHAILEHHILGKNRLDMTDTGQEAHKMADIVTSKLVIISEFLSPIIFPKNPDIIDAISGNAIIEISILSF